MSRSGHYRRPGNALAGVWPWIRLMRAHRRSSSGSPVLTLARCSAWLFGASGASPGREYHRPDLPWQTWNEPLSRYDVTVTVGCDGGYLPDPAAFTAAAGQAAWGRSASIVSAHLANKIISVVTVTAPRPVRRRGRRPGRGIRRAQAPGPVIQRTSMPVTVRRFAARRAREPPPPMAGAARYATAIRHRAHRARVKGSAARRLSRSAARDG